MSAPLVPFTNFIIRILSFKRCAFSSLKVCWNGNQLLLVGMRNFKLLHYFLFIIYYFINITVGSCITLLLIRIPFKTFRFYKKFIVLQITIQYNSGFTFQLVEGIFKNSDIILWFQNPFSQLSGNVWSMNYHRIKGVSSRASSAQTFQTLCRHQIHDSQLRFR